MPRKGQRIKTRKPSAIKPQHPVRRAIDPLAHNALLTYMNAHFEWMQVSNYSNDTVRARRVAIRRFITWCDERGLERPQDISKAVLERYQRYLFYYRKPDGKPMTVGSQLGCLAPLKTWFKWLARENHIMYNPASELALPRGHKALPRTILSVEEMEAILAQAEPITPQLIRDRAMMEVLYSTGLRRMELTGLATYDIDFTREIAMVREGKGKKDRVVPVGERALAWVDKYLLEARPLLLVQELDALFINDYGDPASAEFLANRVRRYMEFAGINKPGACHLFRHACATHMLDRGADIRFIQALLGHSQLSTTEIYTHVSIEKLKSIHAATHPAHMRERVQLQAALDAEAEEDNEAL